VRTKPEPGRGIGVWWPLALRPEWRLGPVFPWMPPLWASWITWKEGNSPFRLQKAALFMYKGEPGAFLPE